MTAVQQKPQKALRPLEPFYLPYYHAEYRTTVAYRTELRINDASMGILLPDQYSPVALRSERASKLCREHLELSLNDLIRFEERGVFFEFLSLPVPPRYLLKDGLLQDLSELSEQLTFDHESLCLTFPEQLLYEDATLCAPLLKELKAMGFTLALNGIGNPLSPILRIRDFSVDLVELHPYFTEHLLKDQEPSSFSYISEMLSSLGIQLIADGVDSAEDAQILAEHHCLYSEGKLAGKGHRASGVRA